MADRDESVTFDPRTLESWRVSSKRKDKYHEIWIIITKKEHADPQPVSFTEAVNAAVKQGLIDSRTKTLTSRSTWYASRREK